MKAIITIDLILADSQYRPIVADFISVQYAQRIGVIPPLPEIIFAAMINSDVVGTIALEFSNRNKPLPFEKIFLLNQTNPFHTVLRNESIQYSRWTSTETNVSIMVGYAATCYALECGRFYGWSELKPKVADRLRLLGITVLEIPDAIIQLDQVEGCVKTYYATSPLPKLYRIDLKQVASVFKQRLIKISRQQEFIIKTRP